MVMRSLALFAPGALVLTSLLLAPGAIAQADPSGTWLDGDTNWNTPGATLPSAPAQDGDNFDYCAQVLRPAALPEDALVEAAGWRLTGAAQIFGRTTVVTGAANADGMCRPLVYQVFVFTDGQFSGTLSPTPMDSRTDGSTVEVNLYRDGYLSAAFNRYAPEDALCCASAQSLLFFEVEDQEGAAVLVPQLPASTSPSASEP